MRIRSISAMFGLALALALAALGTTPANGSEDGVVVAASADSSPAVTVPLVEQLPAVQEYPTTPRYGDVPRQTPPPPPEPAPVPEPVAQAPQPPPVQAAPGSIDDILARHFGDAAGTAKRIAQCESGLDPNAVSSTNDHGLFQINIGHRGQFEAVTGAPWSAVYDAELNTIYAKWLYDQQGWGPWACA